MALIHFGFTKPVSQDKHQIFGQLILGVAFMILIMVVIGGLTRLTGSGLSIVEWKPISGIIPPLRVEDWNELFIAYQQTPEYNLIHKGMTLGEFQSIFWLEFIHRFWGRLMGFAFLVPLFYVFYHSTLACYRTGMIGIFILGALQGAVGWWMVKSGLIHDPHVSPYRLMIHLLLALLTYTGLIGMYFHSKGIFLKAPKKFWCLVFLMGATIAYGALVAGFKAGLIYNDFPLMGGHLLPEDFAYLSPLYRNFFENPATIQWVHRVLALSTVTVLGYYTYNDNRYRFAFYGSLIQACLGIFTLVYQVPVILGASHQLGAFIVWSLMWFGYFLPFFGEHKVFLKNS